MKVSLFMVEGLYAHLSGQGQALNESWLRDAGVSQEERREGRARLDLEAMLRVGRAAYRISEDPALGLHAAESAPWRSLGLLGSLLLQCTTLWQALHELDRYFVLLTDRGRLRLRDEGHTTSLSLELPLQLVQTPEAQRFVAEYAFTMLARVAQEYLGPDKGLSEVRLPFPEPAYGSEYRRIFGCDVFFDQVRAEMVFVSEQLGQAAWGSDERLLRLLKLEADTALESETLGVPLHRRVYSLLRSDPGLCDAGPNKLGKLLGMSARRLRRRLVTEGKCLSGLIEDARLDRARYLLAETDVAIKSIAERLGYSEPSAFHRAFKRWTGQTPGEYKRDQRALSVAC